MSGNWNERVQKLFHEACDLPQDQRAAFLDQSCADAPDVRREVESLLHHDDAAYYPPGLSKWIEQDREPTPSAPSPVPPEKLGEYRVLREIGAGGMGVVYEAEQAQPRRHVALKLIRFSDLTDRGLARFKSESEILGRLEHRGIARIYEAGTAQTAAGPQPFLSMELVQGQSLLEHCRTHSLSLLARLKLFVEVCRAVTHAHQNAVIHRDLKPGNILVNEEGQPKVLDFGVAKATDADPSVRATRTRSGQLIGTLAYMSPEQAAGKASDVDTRSDLYSLGMILYEMLTGALPYEVEGLTVLDAVRVIQNRTPLPLRRRAPTLAADLETIVGKCLEKDKERRYSSVSALQDDIQRFLRHEVIDARPATTWYQLVQFSRRNRNLVASMLGVVALLTIGLIVQTQLRHRAEEQLARAQTLSGMYADMLAAANPFEGGRQGLLMREFLSEQAPQAIDQLEEFPDLRADFGVRLATALAGLGDIESALAHARDSLTIAQSLEGDHAELVLRAEACIAEMLNSLRDHEEAEARVRASLVDARETLGNDHELTLRLGDILQATLSKQSKHTEAAAVAEELYEQRRRLLGVDSPRTLATRVTFATSLYDLGQYEESLQILVETGEALREVAGRDAPNTLLVRGNIAILQMAMGQTDVAVEEFRALRDDYDRVLGPRHFTTLKSSQKLGQMLEAGGHHDEADEVFRQLLEWHIAELGPDHRDVLAIRNSISRNLINQGQLTRAAEEQRKVVQILDENPGLLRPQEDGVLRMTLGHILTNLQQLEEAEQIHRDALARIQGDVGSGHADVAICRRNLALTVARAGRLREAESLSWQACWINRKLLGDTHPSTTGSIEDVKSVQTSMIKALDEALLQHSVATKQGMEFAIAQLGNLVRAGRFEEAWTLLESIEDHSQLLEQDPRLKGQWLLYEGLCQFEEGEWLIEEQLVEALELLEASAGEQDPETKYALWSLQDFHEQDGDPETAETYRRRFFE